MKVELQLELKAEGTLEEERKIAVMEVAVIVTVLEVAVKVTVVNVAAV